jgi:thymidine kinase
MTECNQHRGTLCIRLGPMVSGKTSWLNAELTEKSIRGMAVIKIIHSCDDRDDVASNGYFGSTHNPEFKGFPARIKCVRASNLKDVDIKDYDIIGIDEAQFFPDLYEIVKDWVENKRKHIKVSGLDGDSFKHKFGQTLDLIPLSDECVKLKAKCKLCLDHIKSIGLGAFDNLISDAPFTKRLVQSTDQVLIGGTSMYIPVCGYHHS